MKRNAWKPVGGGGHAEATLLSLIVHTPTELTADIRNDLRRLIEVVHFEKMNFLEFNTMFCR
jgi:hypothetical protein